MLRPQTQHTTHFSNMNNNTPPPIIIIKLKSIPNVSVTEDLIFDNYSGTYLVI